MYCPHCGASIHENSKNCIECGKRVTREKAINTHNELTFLPGVLSFILPLLGFILYLVLKDTRSFTSKACLKGAIVGLVFYLIIGVLFFLFWFFVLIGIFT
jgi:uncharacterized membrane protein YvbJ